MEGFLKEITQKGFIRRTSVLTHFSDTENELPNYENELLVLDPTPIDSPNKG